MLERLERAVTRAAEPLEEAVRASLAGEELDGRVQVRLRLAPCPAPCAFRQTGKEQASQHYSKTLQGLCLLALPPPLFMSF